MNGDKSMFKNFEPQDNSSEYITLDDNGRGHVLGYGKIPISSSHSLSKVMLVDNVHFNLLSIS